MSEGDNVNQDDFDPAHLAQAAKEALGFDGPSSLDGPSNGYMNMDEGFGVVYSYAPDAGDLIAESNYHATFDMVRSAAGDNADRDVQESSVRHWTYSYYDIILVRVYEPGYEPDRWEHVDEHPQDVEDVRYTAAFLQAVKCADARQNYPLLDESDYNQREYEAWEKEIGEGIAAAQRALDVEDDPDDEAEIRRVMFELIDEEGESAADALGGEDGYTPDNVDYDKVKEWYAKAREEMFARRVAAFWGDPIEIHRDTPGSGTILFVDPNQLTLFEEEEPRSVLYIVPRHE